MANETPRQRLARLMDGRRTELGLTWSQVADRAGMSREGLRRTRNGTGRIRSLTRHGIERALAWKPGSIEAILDGGAPVVDEDEMAVEDGSPRPRNAQGSRHEPGTPSGIPESVAQALEGKDVRQWHMLDVSSRNSDEVLMVMWVGPRPGSDEVEQLRADLAEDRQRRLATIEAIIEQRDKWDSRRAPSQTGKEGTESDGAGGPVDDV